jgi:four helix bundle protein
MWKCGSVEGVKVEKNSFCVDQLSRRASYWRKMPISLKEHPSVSVRLSFLFSLNLIRFVEELENNRKFTVANQLLRSGTASGANVMEAQEAESKKDFIHKIKVAAKEAKETSYWLQLCQHSPSYPFDMKLLVECGRLEKILGKIIISSKKNMHSA